MSSKQDKEISISPTIKRHQHFLMTLGLFLILLILLLSNYFWHQYKIQLIFLLLVSFVVLFTGIAKFTEPSVSYKLTPESLCYTHRVGSWSISWETITRMSIIKITKYVDTITLPYVGLKLKSIADLAENISPRLANKLLHEQQELLILAANNQQVKLENGLINFNTYELNGKKYAGPIAAWLYRTEQLNNIYGFHLYLPTSSFDRSDTEFLNLLKQCQSYVEVNY